LEVFHRFGRHTLYEFYCRVLPGQLIKTIIQETAFDHVFLVEMDYYLCFFRCICDMLLPFWLVYFIDRPELRLGCLYSNLLHPLSSPLLHERIVIVEIYVVLSSFLDLLLAPSKLWIVEFVSLDGIIVDILCSGLLFDC